MYIWTINWCHTNLHWNKGAIKLHVASWESDFNICEDTIVFLGSQGWLAFIYIPDQGACLYMEVILGFVRLVTLASLNGFCFSC